MVFGFDSRVPQIPPPICCKVSPESVLTLRPINSTGMGQMVHTGRSWAVPSLIELERGPRERACAHELTKNAYPLLSLLLLCQALLSLFSSGLFATTLVGSVFFSLDFSGPTSDNSLLGDIDTEKFCGSFTNLRNNPCCLLWHFRPPTPSS